MYLDANNFFYSLRSREYGSRNIFKKTDELVARNIADTQTNFKKKGYHVYDVERMDLNNTLVATVPRQRGDVYLFDLQAEPRKLEFKIKDKERFEYLFSETPFVKIIENKIVFAMEKEEEEEEEDVEGSCYLSPCICIVDYVKEANPVFIEENPYDHELAIFDIEQNNVCFFNDETLGHLILAPLPSQNKIMIWNLEGKYIDSIESLPMGFNNHCLKVHREYLIQTVQYHMMVYNFKNKDKVTIELQGYPKVHFFNEVDNCLYFGFFNDETTKDSYVLGCFDFEKLAMTYHRVQRPYQPNEEDTGHGSMTSLCVYKNTIFIGDDHGKIIAYDQKDKKAEVIGQHNHRITRLGLEGTVLLSWDVEWLKYTTRDTLKFWNLRTFQCLRELIFENVIDFRFEAGQLLVANCGNSPINIERYDFLGFDINEDNEGKDEG